MPEAESLFSQWAHLFLVWVGFGTLVGLLAKAIFPGRDPGGALGTVVVGVVGSVIGAGILLFFSADLRVTPISPLGFVVAIAGTSLLLLVYRLLYGRRFYSDSLSWRGRQPRRRVPVIERDAI